MTTNEKAIQLSWLVIPGPPGDFKFLTVEDMQTVLHHAAKYEVGAVFLHGHNVYDYIFTEKYKKYDSLLGSAAARTHIEGNITYLKTMVSMIKQAGLKAILSCSIVSLPHAYLKGCHNYLNPFVSCYPEVMDADGEFFWKLIDDQITDLFDNVPALDGLDVYLTESNFEINSLSGSLTNEDKLVKLFSVIEAACNRLSKTFSVMCFAHTKSDNDITRTALERLSSNTHLMIRHFTNSCDYHPCMPENGNIGKVGSHLEGLEIDCIGEYWGQGRIPSCSPLYIKDRLTSAMRSAPRFREVVCRVNWEWGYIFDTPNEANIYIIHKLLKDPQLSAEELLRMWASEKYGEKASGAVAHALSPTFEVTSKIFYLLGFWVSTHSEVPSLEYAYDHLIGYGTEHAERVPETRSLLMELLHPTEKTVQRVIEEKDQAAEICRQSLKEIESVRTHLTGPAYRDLCAYFDLELNCVKIWRLFAELLVRRQIYINGDCSQIKIIQARLKDLTGVADDTEQKFGSSIRPGNADAIRTFIRDITLDMKLDTYTEQSESN